MLSGTHRNSLQEQVIYGRPALEALTDLAKAFGAHRLMITSTASLAGPGGLAQRLAKDSGAACVGIFAGVSAHSPREGVIAGAAEARRLGADLLVAVGGKVMQLALWAGVGSVEGLGAYRVGPGPDRADVSKLTPGVRMVAIPTTLSAAEFTAFAGVTDVSRRAKEGYGHPLLAPRAVVLDPAISLSTPPQLWFSTGMKAVDHAVEQLCNPVRSPYADALAEAGLKGLVQGLLATKVTPG
jgi:maleylacetate reductase